MPLISVMERCFCMALWCRSGRVKLYLEYCALFVLQESANHASRTTYRAFRYANRPTWNKSTKSTIRVCDGPMDSLCTRRFGGPSCRKDTDQSWQRLDPRWNQTLRRIRPFHFFHFSSNKSKFKSNEAYQTLLHQVSDSTNVSIFSRCKVRFWPPSRKYVSSRTAWVVSVVS